MPNKYQIQCKNCKIDVDVIVGWQRRTVQSTGLKVYYCPVCKKIHSEPNHTCDKNQLLLGPPKEFLEAKMKERHSTMTVCPKCGNKTLQWSLLERYET